jgi:hypothetical protein
VIYKVVTVFHSAYLVALFYCEPRLLTRQKQNADRQETNGGHTQDGYLATEGNRWDFAFCVAAASAVGVGNCSGTSGGHGCVAILGRP